MVCATAINYGLFSILNMYFNNTPYDHGVYDAVQINMISVIVIIGVVTVIMAVLIPKENMNQILSEMNEENN